MRRLDLSIARCCALLCALLLSSCAGARERRAAKAPVPVAPVAEPEAALVAARELAGHLPRQANRCVVAMPSRVATAERSLVGLASSGERLPWVLPIPVLAYARGEFLRADEHLATVELIRFTEAPAPAIREALAKADERALSWNDQDGCAGELTCVPVHARFLDPRTLLITSRVREPLDTQGGSNGPCARLLDRAPDAVEVSGRHLRGGLEGADVLAAETALYVRSSGVERVTRRHFSSAALAARAQRLSLTGGEDLPLLAGNPARLRSERSGALLWQSARISFEDLRFSLDDQARLQAALTGERSGVDLDQPIELQDAERVIEHVDQSLAALPADPGVRQRELARLDRLLARARHEQPSHDGLARRHYQLLAGSLGNPRAALEVADARLNDGSADAGYWQLARRAALARFDESRLRLELMRTHHLAASEAARFARELSDQVRRGGADYERAEWVVTTAHSLASRARRLKTAHIQEVRLPLEQWPRLLAYWARLGRSHEDADLGVHVLGFGAHNASTVDSDLWVADTAVAGRPATVIAASTWDEGQLIAQGRALRERFAAGPLELVVGVETIDQRGAVAGHRGFVVSMGGRFDGSDFVLDQVSEPLARVNWDRLLRCLAEPLSLLRGNVFPPDELLISARAKAEVDLLARAAEDAADVRCAVEGAVLRCRGGLGDARAAARALLRAARVVLGSDADAPWSGTD